jgi:hypothetical protein
MPLYRVPFIMIKSLHFCAPYLKYSTKQAFTLLKKKEKKLIKFYTHATQREERLRERGKEGDKITVWGGVGVDPDRRQQKSGDLFQNCILTIEHLSISSIRENLSS